MATIHDIAAAVLNKFPKGLSASALQKLVYLSQGWSLALRNEPLFPGEFEAWPSGPVSRSLYNQHINMFSIHTWPHGDPTLLDEAEQLIVDAVVRRYGALTGLQLAELPLVKGTPWMRAYHKQGNKTGSRALLAEDEMQRHFTALLIPRGYERKAQTTR